MASNSLTQTALLQFPSILYFLTLLTLLNSNLEVISFICLFQYCPAPAVIYRKYYEFSIFSEVSAYSSAFLLNVRLEKGQKTLFQVSNFFYLDIFAIQPNFLILGLAFRLFILVISLILKLLSIVKIFFIYRYQLLKFKCQLIFKLGFEA